MKFAGFSIGAALALTLTASAALAAPAENARGPLLGQAQAQGRGVVVSPPAPPPALADVALRRPALSMQAVIDIIRRRTPGQQADVVLDGANYRVRWKADNGRLIDYIVDAQSGLIRSARGE